MKRLFVLGFGVMVGCSSSNERAPSPMTDSGGEDVVFDGTVPVDASSETSILDGGFDTKVVDTGFTPLDTGPPPDASTASICPKAYSDSTPVVDVTYPGSAAGAKLAGITWDELTMAWTTQAAGATVIHYADRSGRDAAFTSELLLSDALGPFPDEKVALSADGLTMLFVSANHETITQITRSARGAAFDPASATTAPFVRLVGAGGEGGAAKQVGDVTLSKDGKLLFYTNLSAAVGASILVSLKLGDGTWDAPNAITASRLAIASGARRRPTGFSSDNKALFFFDDGLLATFVAFRAGDSLNFTDFVGFSPTGNHAQPTDACDRVYLDVDRAVSAGDAKGTTMPTIVHSP